MSLKCHFLEIIRYNTTMKNFTILCIDDEKIVIETISEILSAYNVVGVSDATLVMDILHNNEVDLILLDIVMPKISGLQLCKEIKSYENLSHIPILFITANDTDEYIQNAFSYGAVDFIKKPIRAVDLQQRVKLHLKDHLFKIDKHYTFDTKSSLLYNDNAEIYLTNSEQKLLALFIQNIDAVLDPIEISNHVFGYEATYNNKTIRNLISSLKKKLPDDLIKTIYSQGYQFHLQPL